MLKNIALKIYPYIPISVQNIFITLYGFLWNKRRFGGDYNKEYKEFVARENFNSAEWEKYQEEKLQAILLHAYHNVPYYTNQLFPFKNQLASFKIQEIKQLPILEKNTLREFGTNQLLSKQLEKGGEYFASSGSTGTPTKILISPRMHQVWTAGFEARIRNWAGVTKDTPRGTIGGRRIIAEGINKGPYYRYNHVERQVYFSAYHISANTVNDYLEGMNKYGIEYMTGYAMSNYFLARFIEENGLKAPKLKAVITSSEKLTQEMRDTFMRVYGCKSYDSYSGVEDCGMISECEHGKLHISPDLGIIEIIKSNGEPALPGETGEAICTGILNFDQPLIRYRIGDLLKLASNQKCECGRNMPIVEEIVGRLEDTVIGSDGREMVRFHGVFINIPEIIEGQIIQHTLTDFEIKVVTSQQLDESQQELILKRMQSQLGEISLSINEVESIPRNQNGKFKAVISNLKR